MPTQRQCRSFGLAGCLAGWLSPVGRRVPFDRRRLIPPTQKTRIRPACEGAALTNSLNHLLASNLGGGGAAAAAAAAEGDCRLFIHSRGRRTKGAAKGERKRGRPGEGKRGEAARRLGGSEGGRRFQRKSYIQSGGRQIRRRAHCGGSLAHSGLQLDGCANKPTYEAEKTSSPSERAGGQLTCAP